MIQLENWFIKFIADYLVVPIVLLGAWAILSSPKNVRWQRVGWAAVAGGVALALAWVASLFYQDKRPFLAAGVSAKASYLINMSFPSLHVLLVFTATFIVWGATKRPLVSLIMLGLSIVVAIGRMVALVHSPVDVLGGVGCALLAYLLVYGHNLMMPKPKEK
ncbi:MAG TPA: phosphatase PAP2 family protein [Candidatus Acidoferrum sp.]|nr:phosphatase PAP2 family protein [Candidatus Acidoferrum sp.]